MAASDFKLIRPVTLVDAMVTSSVTEADATKWDGTPALPAGTVRMVVDSTGTPTTITHGIYTLKTGGDSSVDPTGTSGATNWELTGYTNAWKMFDPEYQTQTSNASTIEVNIQTGGLVTAVALLNLEANEVIIEQTGSMYSRTFDLVSHVVSSWWEYFTEVPVRTGELVVTDIPPYFDEVLTITINNSGGTAKCGVCVVGKYKTLGASQWGASRSIVDYSQAIEADTGVVTLSQGAYSKRLNVEFRIDPGYESEATRTLEMFRATPLVFCASEDYDMTIIYGFLGSWDVPITETGKPAYVEIKGLV